MAGRRRQTRGCAGWRVRSPRRPMRALRLLAAGRRQWARCRLRADPARLGASVAPGRLPAARRRTLPPRRCCAFGRGGCHRQLVLALGPRAAGRRQCLNPARRRAGPGTVPCWRGAQRGAAAAAVSWGVPRIIICKILKTTYGGFDSIWKMILKN